MTILGKICEHLKEFEKNEKEKNRKKREEEEKLRQALLDYKKAPVVGDDSIDENDVIASHGAVVGQLNSDHMFYLMSRGLSKEEARKIIILGYLNPISVYFSKENQEKISNIIMEAV